jgi:hypothetical protein
MNEAAPNEVAQLERLRELFLSAPESEAVRILAVLASVALAVVVLWLVRNRTLRAEYTPIYMGTALALLIVSVRFEILRELTRTLGAWTTSSTIFFLGEVFLFLICLNYAVRLSQTGLRLKNLAQEVALLREQIERGAPREPAAHD